MLMCKILSCHKGKQLVLDAIRHKVSKRAVEWLCHMQIEIDHLDARTSSELLMRSFTWSTYPNGSEVWRILYAALCFEEDPSMYLYEEESDFDPESASACETRGIERVTWREDPP
jgi:hypothetical protein